MSEGQQDPSCGIEKGFVDPDSVPNFVGIQWESQHKLEMAYRVSVATRPKNLWFMVCNLHHHSMANLILTYIFPVVG